MLELRFLGNFDIRIDGEPINLPSRKAQSLLAYLVLNMGGKHRREKLAGLLWPDNSEDNARTKLRYALWKLRKTIGDQYFLTDKITIGFDPNSDFWLDCSILEGDHPERLSIPKLRKMISLYEGELLPGFYEDWVILERERLQASFEQRIQILLQRLIDEERWREVLEWGEHWISLSQSPEPAFRALMVAHSQLGDVSSALSAYQRCTQILGEELGVEPSKETQQIHELILKGEKPLDTMPRLKTLIPSSKDFAEESPFYLELEEGLPEGDGSIFVARESELLQLEQRLEVTLADQGQVVFVLGDAGQGKTSLLYEFSRQAQRVNKELVVASGSCEAHTGFGDPHLPFREILALLTGDVEAKWTSGTITRENAHRLLKLMPQSVQALLDLGPDLINTFVSGASLERRSSNYAQDSPEWLGRLQDQIELRRERPNPINIEHSDIQKDLFDQYSKVIHKLSGQQPLLLVLDDLQWADLGSISLLFHLGRRIKGHRILILGAYRPDEITQVRDGTRHPLNQVLTEFKRTFGETDINLDKADELEARKFVDALVDTEPNRLGEEFRHALHLHTGGHALFTIELLRQLEAQGYLQKDQEGRWVESPELSWDTLPARVEAVIEGRVSRLPTELRDILDKASVEGQEFTAEIVAEVSGLPVQEIVHRLSHELDKQYLLVEASGIQRIGQQRLSLYRFRHILFQKYVYESLDEVERVHLHENVGLAIERLYQDQTGQVVVRLARHFEEAGVNDKAVEYLLEAADQAKLLSANEEAINHLTKGLDLLHGFPIESKRLSQELAIQISLGAPLVATKGYAAPEVESTFERARDLCEQIGEIEQLAPALWGLSAFYQVRAKHLVANELAQQILALAQSGENNDLLLVGHWTAGITQTHLGEFSLARDHLEKALEIYNGDRHLAFTYLYGQNPGVTCLNYLALNLWILGYPDEALEKCEQAISLANDISHPFSQSFAHGMVSLHHALKKDSEAASYHSEETIRLSKESGFPFLMALGLIIRGWARADMGKPGIAINLMRKGIETMEKIGAEIGRPLFLSLLAEGYCKAEQNDEGLAVTIEALDTAGRNGEYWNIADLYRLKGDLLAMKDGRGAETTASYRQALEIAHQQNARSIELRAEKALASYLERTN